MNYFNDWVGIARVLVFGTLAYGALIALLRISGKRTLSKMNAFDLVVTVALGLTLAAAVLTPSVALVESLVAFTTLVGLQALVAFSQTRLRWVEALVRSEPSLLVRDGRMLTGAQRRERMTEAEVLQAVRASGRGSIDGIAAVILETDGSMSVIGSSESAAGAAGGEAPA